MRIALIGYGKMGKTIERIAMARGHEIVLRISSANAHEVTPETLSTTDVAIEFTGPDTAAANVIACLSAGVNTISGSTGWNHQLAEAGNAAAAAGTAFLQASNFSIGVNIFFEINKLLASLMNGRDEYSPLIEETHHIHKKDAPGGTAITLAQQILQAHGSKEGWVLNDTSQPQLLPVIARRVDEVPGTHKVSYSSAIDDIEIKHTAHNRDGFAIGAVLAAEFINGRQGVFSMKDVLGIT